MKRKPIKAIVEACKVVAEDMWIPPEFRKSDLSEIKKIIDKHPYPKPEKGDWCDLDPEDNRVVVFYRKSGQPYMWVPLDVYEEIRNK